MYIKTIFNSQIFDYEFLTVMKSLVKFISNAIRCSFSYFIIYYQWTHRIVSSAYKDLEFISIEFANVNNSIVCKPLFIPRKNE